jgi:hypothetical protein
MGLEVSHWFDPLRFEGYRAAGSTVEDRQRRGPHNAASRAAIRAGTEDVSL